LQFPLVEILDAIINFFLKFIFAVPAQSVGFKLTYATPKLSASWAESMRCRVFVAVVTIWRSRFIASRIVWQVAFLAFRFTSVVLAFHVCLPVPLHI
jgi:hypothetical protein